ncbi:MAG: Asp-tRNA(Asn)/Glu-tRNA(Gln) amidotransferase subunit GatC [Alphaproteobacteria bacterium]|nr:Asp-tRNA(Asn)/Glu-tRNA(Gln) amidotransferase subunit GatC [Alphaproteobacteria bacterium]
MSFTTQQLSKFAHLIRIDIPDEQLEQMDISSVIGWLDRLQKIDTGGVTPMLTSVEHAAPLRNDIVTDGNIRDAVLASAPDAAQGYFAVPKVMDE